MKHTVIIALILTLLLSFLQWVEIAIETCKLFIIDQVSTSLGVDFLMKCMKVSFDFSENEIQFVKLK